MTRVIKRIVKSKIFVLIVLLTLMTVFFAVVSKGSYIGLKNIRNIFSTMVITTLLTVGAVPLMISGQIDLSTGNIANMSGVLLASLLTTLGLPWPLALIVTLAVAGVIGLLNAVLVNRFGFQAFITTLAVASIVKGTTYMIGNSSAIPIKDSVILYLGSGKIADIIPVTIIIALAALLIYGFILAKTVFGKNVYLIGSNPNAAWLAGLNPQKISYVLFVNNAVLGGLAGCLLAARFKAGTMDGVGNGQFAGITGAILGGVSFGGGAGGMGGAFIGLLLLSGFSNGLTVIRLSPYWQVFASGALLIIALALDFLNQRRTGKIN